MQCPLHRLAVGKSVSQAIGHLLLWHCTEYGTVICQTDASRVREICRYLVASRLLLARWPGAAAVRQRCPWCSGGALVAGAGLVYPGGTLE